MKSYVNNKTEFIELENLIVCLVKSLDQLQNTMDDIMKSIQNLNDDNILRLIAIEHHCKYIIEDVNDLINIHYMPDTKLSKLNDDLQIVPLKQFIGTLHNNLKKIVV